MQLLQQLLGLVLGSLPGLQRHGLALGRSEQQVFFLLAYRAQHGAQLTQGHAVGKRFFYQRFAHAVDAQHPQHARTAQHSQQQQHHDDRAPHAQTDGEAAHQCKHIHAPTPCKGDETPPPL